MLQRFLIKKAVAPLLYPLFFLAFCFAPA